MILPYYACATCLHLLVSVFQKNPISRRAVVTVVVESGVPPLASNEVPNVNATAAVPVTEIRNVSPSTGVPVRLVVKDVIAAVCPVIWTTS